MSRKKHPQTRCFFDGSADGRFAKGSASMLYKTPSRRPLVNLFRDTARGLAPLKLQKIDYQWFTKSMVPNPPEITEVWHGLFCNRLINKYLRKCWFQTSLTWPKTPQPERENPAVKAGLFRVYGQWDNYRTSFDDYREVYLLGIQLDME